jgi:hypothetical protein
MWTLLERRTSLSAGRALALLVIVLLALTAAGNALQAQSAPADPQTVRQQIEQRYEVIPIRGGILLQPRKERLAVRSIEIAGSSIAINGERMPLTSVREWLGPQEAAPVLRLLEMSPGDRRALFGLDREGALPAPPDAPDAPDVPDMDTDTDTDVDTDLAVDTDASAVPAPPLPPGLPDDEEGQTADDTADDGSKARIGQQVRFGSGVTVGKDEIAESVAVIGGSVRVEGEVEENVAAIFGSVRIDGRVGGNVSAINGKVILGPKAEIQGNVSSVGGRIERQPGSKILGSTSEVPGFMGGVGDDWDWDGDVHVGPWTPFGASVRLFSTLTSLLILALLVGLTILLARRPLELADYQLRTEPWKCALTGVLAALFSLPLLAVVTALLILTVIGCLLFLLYPFLAVFFVLILILGYSAAAHRLGRWTEVRFNWTPGGTFRAAMIGLLLIEVWTVLGRILALGSGPLDWIAGTILLFGFTVRAAAWTVGFGSVLLAWFANRPPRWRAAAPPGGPGGPVTYAPPVPVEPAGPAGPVPPLPVGPDQAS